MARMHSIPECHHKDMRTRTHSWITYTLAYLLAVVIENTFCYLTIEEGGIPTHPGRL